MADNYYTGTSLVDSLHVDQSIMCGPGEPGHREVQTDHCINKFTGSIYF